ncbi:MAG: biotin/lipoate A/B protein ligase family protein [Halanaeroarchaeum sp.]
MDPTDRDVRLVREERRSGPMQMALDEIAARTVADGGPWTVRVYSWEPSTLSLGYHQDPETVDWAALERADVEVTRRQTGGGGIYHDAVGDISYSIALPTAAVPGDLLESYDRLMTPIFEAFDRMGIDASYVDEERPARYEPACYLRELHPAHDVVVDGRKISGNAQYRTREAIIQHGSLSFASDPERHLGAFVDPAVDAAGFRDRVTSIRETGDVDRDGAVAALESALANWADAEEAAWTAAELESARSLAREKYAAAAWNRRREDPTE